MQSDKYLIDPIHLKRLKTQLQYRLRLKENIKELQTEPKKTGSILDKLKKLF